MRDLEVPKKYQRMGASGDLAPVCEARMSDVLLYWRDYQRSWRERANDPRAWFWHSNSRVVADLRPGDRMWMIASGRAVGHEPAQAGFLLGMWNVREVVDNPDDEPDYPAAEYDTARSISSVKHGGTITVRFRRVVRQMLSRSSYT